ncbi:NirD/YgiW/YdeI family stress tolerance protein [Tepidicaulis sp. LMO-SS28]|uniref:NirD/YgiW/YdeI family stress tolerance protein n=1 Tax=Tepidicaulis sp. LMO-SS28 TaxID=3447455 RepID=UPI003EE2FB35
MKNRNRIISAGLAVSALALSAPSFAAMPEDVSDNSWITLAGTVNNVTSETFELDYGEGEITVEMDDWDFYSEAELLEDGDVVSVQGKIDKDFLENAKLEASNVYVDNRDTFYYANPVDEEDWVGVATAPRIVTADDIDGSAHLTGTVKNIDGREISLQTGASDIMVDTSALEYNPLDESGFQRIGEGDRISVTGTFQDSFFDNPELVASSVITLEQNS